MQSIGFAYAIEPVLRKLYPDPAEYESRIRLHLEYFNTQPFLASYILGAVVRMEEDRAIGRNAGGDVPGLKAALMSPLGALGDSFFWGALKPLAAVVAVALLMTGYWWAPLVFLVFYNTWHVGLRAGMLFWGYQSGGDAVALMTRYSLMKTTKRFKLITLTVLGGIIGMAPGLETGVPADGQWVVFVDGAVLAGYHSGTGRDFSARRVSDTTYDWAGSVLSCPGVRGSH